MKVGDFKPTDVQHKKDKDEKHLLTNTQKGLISLGVFAGAAYAISTKRSFWGIVGFMWLGSIAGGGVGYFFKKTEKK